MAEASQLRMTAATSQNDVSSRSHTVFTLSVVQQRDARKPVTGAGRDYDCGGSPCLVGPCMCVCARVCTCS